MPASYTTVKPRVDNKVKKRHSKASNRFTSKEKKEILAKHNYYRSKVAKGQQPGQPSAKNMQKMVANLLFYDYEFIMFYVLIIIHAFDLRFGIRNLKERPRRVLIVVPKNTVKQVNIILCESIRPPIFSFYLQNMGKTCSSVVAKESRR